MRGDSHIRSIDAVTLAVSDMARSHAFYASLGFECTFGGPEADFSTFRVGSQFLNLMAVPDAPAPRFWGRVIIHVTDVDGMYRRVVDGGFEPEARPRDAEWGERYFHVADPDGHGLSFARRL